MKLANRSGASFAVIVGEQEHGRRHRRDQADAWRTIKSTIRPVRAHRSSLRNHELMTESTPTNQSTSMRTHLCGALRDADVGSTVSVCGWVGRRREHGEHLAFVDLRDHSGIVAVRDQRRRRRPQRVRAADHAGRSRTSGGHRQRCAPDRPGRRSATVEVEVLRERHAPPFPSTPGPTTSTRTSGSSTATSICVASGCRRTSRRAPRSTPRSATRWSSQDFVEVETPMLVPVDTRGRARVPRAVAQGARLVLRAAAVAAALQAVADGGRSRPLLPDGPVPARRRPARRPPVRVHAARHGNELRRTRTMSSKQCQQRCLRCRGGYGGAAAPIERMTWHDAMNRFGSDKPDLRFGMELRADRLCLRHRVQGIRGAECDQGHQGRRQAQPTTAATSSTS